MCYYIYMYIQSNTVPYLGSQDDHLIVTKNLHNKLG